MVEIWDHTGEKWNNRVITGKGEVRVSYRQRKGKPYTLTEQLWRWECIKCGKTGESIYAVIQRFTHRCPAKRSTASRPDSPYVCTKQCKGCGHYRAMPMFGSCCNYLIDVGSMRPKVDLRTEECPVRDTKFKPKRCEPMPLYTSMEILKRIIK